MTTLYITEYSNIAVVDGQSAQVGQEPAIAEQAVTFTTATASAAFNAGTRFIRVFSTGACHLAFGTAPVATTSMQKVAANVPEWRGVAPTQKVSAVDAA